MSQENLSGPIGELANSADVLFPFVFVALVERGNAGTVRTV